ncbi:BTB/POZ domain-containing protein [Megavirus baoshan]|uniref:BTB/POZ domain-containing protein n=1 Tax=Megavirus baoshan TaxID=2496520 RepID=A0A3Q8U8K2_9VIRU|nr:BTB/POZ domain-containing protein [Megavirus baoshan]AZL89563.1 BTB/POZ domain-containing protein [Megavirus baoshan]
MIESDNQFIIQEPIRDLVIDLQDGVNKLGFGTNRNIMLRSCKYFEKLLSWDKSNRINILVPNVYVMRDIIMSFHNDIRQADEYPEWEYVLIAHQCHDFIGLKYDKLYQIKIPINKFDKLLDYIDIIGYDNKTIKLLLQNLPLDYDISQFPPELINEMYKLVTKCKIITMNEVGIPMFYNPKIKESNNILNCSKGQVSGHKKNKIIYGSIKKCIAFTNNENIYIVSIETNKLLYKIPNNFRDGYVIYMKFMNNDTQLCIIYSRTFRILDTITWTIVYDRFKIGQKKSIIKNGHISNCNNYLVYVDIDNKIKIWDIINQKIIHTFKQKDVQAIGFSPNSKFLVCVSDDIISIWNIGQKLGRKNFLESKTSSLCFTPDSKYLIITKHNQILVIEIKSLSIIRTFNYGGDYIDSIVYVNDNKLIFGSRDGIVISCNTETGKNSMIWRDKYIIDDICIIHEYHQDLINKIKPRKKYFGRI